VLNNVPFEKTINVIGLNERAIDMNGGNSATSNTWVVSIKKHWELNLPEKLRHLDLVNVNTSSFHNNLTIGDNVLQLFHIPLYTDIFKAGDVQCKCFQ
jgi:hypothetical protein